uniref:Uncharacterized protein n=1 Tax=Noctiluca scintillans TaxID=2966 RepID=A0A7S1FIR9_NOCSC|mmetsp:Transcript_64585/g.170980  ORF Transcript_64585/g.170980 Transcript_64585/m.170980 type:complete len:128 (+) Transcript_64585:71-454(+)
MVLQMKKRGDRVSKTARGRGAKVLVFKGHRERTAGGLKVDMLMKNRRGKVVSKRANASGRRRFVNIEPWVRALMAARECLRISGFVAVNGRTLQGKALYIKTRALYSSESKVCVGIAPSTGAADGGA